MKCIKNLETSEIKRVSEYTAHFNVDGGDWIYIPKSEWKSLKVKVEKVREKFPANVEGSAEFKEVVVAEKKEYKKKKDRIAEQKSKTKKK